MEGRRRFQIGRVPHPSRALRERVGILTCARNSDLCRCHIFRVLFIGSICWQNGAGECGLGEISFRDRVGGWPRLLTSLGQTKQWGAPSFAQFAKGGNRELIHNGVCAEGHKIVWAASQPALAKPQGRGTLHRWRTRTTKEMVRHPPWGNRDRAIAARLQGTS